MRPQTSCLVPTPCAELMTAVCAAVHDGFVVLVAFFTFCRVDDYFLEGLVGCLSHCGCGMEERGELQKLCWGLMGHEMIVDVGGKWRRGKEWNGMSI